MPPETDLQERRNVAPRSIRPFMGGGYGVSLDWLIAGDIATLLKYAAIGYKITMPKAA